VSSALLRRLAIAVAVLVVLALVVWLARKLASHSESGPKKQVAKISILPDTPPPPPPPPPKERKEEPPKAEQRQQQPDNTPKPQASETLKMEGAAGNGPSAFAAGSVSKDYQGGAPVGGGTSGPSASDRAAERLYAGTVRQMLRDEIERQLPAEAGELQATFALWVANDGRLSRWELDPSTPPASQATLEQALKRSAEGLRLPAPNAVPQPLRFKLTLRANG
jgi:hypothetical protein